MKAKRDTEKARSHKGLIRCYKVVCVWREGQIQTSNTGDRVQHPEGTVASFYYPQQVWHVGVNYPVIRNCREDSITRVWSRRGSQAVFYRGGVLHAYRHRAEAKAFAGEGMAVLACYAKPKDVLAVCDGFMAARSLIVKRLPRGGR
jgi:hypothetical protein